MNEVAIIGAGVLGVSLAYHLSKAGISCVILEKEALAASHASGKNAGMIRQLYRHHKLTEWASRSICDMPIALKQQYFIETGSLVVGREIPEHHQELFEKEGNAVRCRTDGLLDSGPYVQALLGLAKKQGTLSYFKHEVVDLKKQNSIWKISCHNGEKFEAKIIVNATGAWINKILPLAKLGAKSYARHLAIIEGFPEDYMPANNCGFYWDEKESWYMRKWAATSRLVSICDQVPCEPEVFPNSIDIKEELANTLFKHLPSIAQNLKIGSFWHCYRTYTEDKLPVIGFDPEDNTFFWLSGFGGFGMSTSYAATEDAARLMQSKPTLDLQSFSPARCK